MTTQESNEAKYPEIFADCSSVEKEMKAVMQELADAGVYYGVSDVANGLEQLKEIRRLCRALVRMREQLEKEKLVKHRWMNLKSHCRAHAAVFVGSQCVGAIYRPCIDDGDVLTCERIELSRTNLAKVGIVSADPFNGTVFDIYVTDKENAARYYLTSITDFVCGVYQTSPDYAAVESGRFKTGMSQSLVDSLLLESKQAYILETGKGVSANAHQKTDS